MIKDSNVLRSVLLPKELADKIQADADSNYTSFNAIVRRILIEYYKNK